MEHSLKPGLKISFKYRVPENKTVPNLFPESDEFKVMPEVFATGYLVGLIEWACIRLINEHINWPDDQTVGTSVNISHSSPTPPGLEITVDILLKDIIKKKLIFEVSAHDGFDTITSGTHERYIINKEKFDISLKNKAVK